MHLQAGDTRKDLFTPWWWPGSDASARRYLWLPMTLLFVIALAVVSAAWALRIATGPEILLPLGAMLLVLPVFVMVWRRRR